MPKKSLLMCIVISVLVTICLFAASAYAEDPPEEVWIKNFDSGSYDLLRGITTDEAGDIYVTGQTHNTFWNNADFGTVKYDSDGNILWNRTYDTEGNDDIPHSVGVDEAGSVYVMGHQKAVTVTPQTVKYDSEGNILWNKIYDSGNDDDVTNGTVSAGFVYLTGWCKYQETRDFLTIKYDYDGNLVWDKIYDSGNEDRSNAVAVDKTDFVYVAGTYEYDGGWKTTIQLIKYDPDGNLLWDKVYETELWNDARDVVVDKEGFVYVVGTTKNYPDYDSKNYHIVKYDPAGNIEWDKTYDSGKEEQATGAAVDHTGIYLTGYFDTETNKGIQTVKYDFQGNLLWEKIYDTEADERGIGITVDEQAYLYVAGWYDNDTNWDYLTIKYRQILDAVEKEPSPNTLGLDVATASRGSIRISYEIWNPTGVDLSVYDASGRKVAKLVNGQELTGIHEYVWTPESAGLYFIRIEAGNSQVTKKFVVIR